MTEGSSDQELRIQALTVVSLVTIGIGVPFVVQYWRLGIGWMSIAIAVTAALCLANLAVLRVTRRLVRAGWIGAGLLLTLITLSNWASGGFYDPNFGWLYVIPIIAALVVDARAGWVFTGIVLALSMLFWAAPELGIVIVNRVPPELWEGQSLANRLSAVFAIGVALGALAHQQRVARRRLTRANEELHLEIGRRAEAQARLVRAERMASMGTLAAAVAHEINNPLAYVVMNLGLLDEQFDVLDSSPPRATDLETAKKLLAEVTDGAQRVRKLVADLKTFSRADADSKAAVDVREAVEQALRMAQNEVRHRARLVTSYEDVPAAKGDESKLVQVILNLLTNAAHAIVEGAASRNEIRVCTRHEGGQVVISVSDTGEGIDDAGLLRVFEPFFTTKPIGVGTGLGLSVCKNLVEFMGGEITLETEIGVGTTVRVALPVFEGTEPAVELARRSVPSSGQPLSVLVIDDESGILNAVRRALKNHDVVVTTDGRSVVERCLEGEFDVVLCDLMMPDFSGADLHAELARRQPGFERRLIFMTGGAFTPKMTAFLSECESPVLRKPFDIDALRATVHAQGALARRDQVTSGA